MRLTSFLISLLFPLFSFANVLGDMQTFSPNTDGLDFITVHTARSLPENYFVFSNYINYAQNHLLVYKTLADQDRIDYKDSLFEYDFGVAYGISKNLQVSLQMPILVSYTGQKTEGILIKVEEGIHSFRPGLKWSGQGDSDSYWAFLGSVDFPFLENSPYTGVDPRPIYNIEGAYSWAAGSRIQSLNLGARIRNPTDTPLDAHMYPLKSQATLSYGISNKFSSTARWVFEAISSYPIDKEPYNEALDASSFDLLLGMKHRWVKNLNFDWGATVEPGVKSLAPTFRLFAGLIYYWKPDSSSEPEEKAEMPPFVVVPDDSTVNTNEWLQYYAENDVKIESCKVVDGPGSLSHGCEFSSEEPGYSRLEFMDSYGRKATRMVTIREQAPTEPLAFTQDEYTVFIGSSIYVDARGGIAPYQYSITKGQGQMEPTGFFEAPLKKQIVYIQATDSKGNVANSKINVVSPQKEDKAIQLSNLEFISGKAELTEASLASLRANVSNLSGVKVKNLIVEGHTDWIGSDAYNQRLSRRRAESVKNTLADQLGLDRSTIDAIGYGESKPIASNKTAAGRQKNRRVVLKVYYRK